MKNNKIYFLVIFLSLMFICCSAFSQTNIDTTCKEYKIEKIIRVKDAYIIYAHNEKDSTWYDVVSVKAKARKCPKIKVGKSYKMMLKPYFKHNYCPNLGFIYSVKINGITVIVPCNSWTGNVYTTPNLKGLFYIKP